MGAETSGDTEHWRLAAAAYEAEPWARGTLITHESMKRFMGLPVVDAAEVAGDEYQRLRLEYTRQVEALREWLATEYQIKLVNIHGKGYRLVLVEEHVSVSNREAREGLNRALSDWAGDLHNAPVDEMTDSQRKALDDSRARLVSVRNNMRKELRGLPTRPPAALPSHEEQDGSDKS